MELRNQGGQKGKTLAEIEVVVEGHLNIEVVEAITEVQMRSEVQNCWVELVIILL